MIHLNCMTINHQRKRLMDCHCRGMEQGRGDSMLSVPDIFPKFISLQAPVAVGRDVVVGLAVEIGVGSTEVQFA